MSDRATREMTLDEYVGRLPEGHTARRELAALRGSARPPVPPQEITEEMVEAHLAAVELEMAAFRRGERRESVEEAKRRIAKVGLEAALRVRGEPARPEEGPLGLKQSLMAPSQWEAVERLRGDLDALRQAIVRVCNGMSRVSTKNADDEYDGGYFWRVEQEDMARLIAPVVVAGSAAPQSSSSEVSRMEPFPLVPIPPHEVEREVKAYNEKFFEHEDLDGMEPYDWREVATLDAAFAGGFLPESDMSEAAAWYNFKKLRATGATDTAHPEFAAFCSWALEILNGPSTPVPDPWPVYDAAAYQAERLRRASE